MISATIYNSLIVPCKPPITTSRSLQWTPDGQLLVLADSLIYILTPETGLKMDHSSVVGLSTPGRNEVLHWSQTAVPLQATELFWPEISVDWATLCIGAIDSQWYAMTHSPTNYSSIGSCLLATLSSNLEVQLWGPKDNPYRGEWTKLQDISKDLRAYLEDSQKLTGNPLVLNSQIQSLVWSHQSPSARSSEASILALGSRGGTVHFCRLKDGAMNCFSSLRVSSGWVTHLAWTKWLQVNDSDTVNACLACALPTGEVVIVDAIQHWDPSNNPVLTVSIRKVSPSQKDQRGITSIEWIEPEGQSPILVYCKPGTVELWRDAEFNGWGGSCSIPLQVQATSTASNSFVPATGINYLSQHDSILVSLIDGSHHAIAKASTDPTYANNEETLACNSESMSKIARQVFLVAEEKAALKPKDGSEPPKLFRDHYPQTMGAVACDTAGVLVWFHEKIFSNSFEFIPDSKRRCMLVTAPLVSPTHYDPYALQEIRMSLAKPHNFLLESPIAALRGSYVHLRRRAFLERNQQEVLALLQSSPELPTKQFPKIDDPMEDDIGTEWVQMAAQELSEALFASEALCRERLKLNMALQCFAVLTDNEPLKTLIHTLQAQISLACLRVRCEFLNEVPIMILKEHGTLLLQRTLQHAKLGGLDEDSTVRNLNSKLLVSNLKATEQCAACGKVISFEEPSFGRCPNGHYWSRCSATSYIMSTPQVLSCIGCGNKSIMPSSSSEQGDLARELLAQIVLQTSRNCFGCGNKCVKIV